LEQSLGHQLAVMDHAGEKAGEYQPHFPAFLHAARIKLFDLS
jgi:hypothetical protein